MLGTYLSYIPGRLIKSVAWLVCRLQTCGRPYFARTGAEEKPTSGSLRLALMVNKELYLYVKIKVKLVCIIKHKFCHSNFGVQIVIIYLKYYIIWLFQLSSNSVNFIVKLFKVLWYFKPNHLPRREVELSRISATTRQSWALTALTNGGKRQGICNRNRYTLPIQHNNKKRKK